MKHFFISLLAALAVTATATAGDSKTYYSKVTASAPSGEGMVYVSREATDAPVYAEVSSDTLSAASDKHKYYLYAQAAPGKEFRGWFEGESLLSDQSVYNCEVTATSQDVNKPTEKVLTARFGERTAAVRISANMPDVGTIAISNPENQVGDEVTLTAKVARVPMYNCRNLMIDFVGWRNGKGEYLSHDMTYTFKVEEPMDVEAVFENKNALKLKGYFRVRNIFNRVLSIVGNYKYESVGSTGNYLDGLLHWRCPDDLVPADFANKSWNATDDIPGVDVEGLASTVIYISGDNLDVNAQPDGNALKSVNAFGQGTETKKMTGQTLTIKPAIATCPGYYILYGGLSAGLKMTHREGDEDRDGDGVNDGHFMYCSPLLGRCKYDDPYSWMALQPIDEEHIDDFWFGATADESMLFDGGYWTSMYTGFPYECRDGVEAYYAKEVVTANGVAYIQVEKIESGIVPAYSAVLLKCNGLRSRENRLMPLDFDANYGKLDGNLLEGSFQLHTDKNGNGRVKFDETTMRVFSANAAGELGFYKLKGQADGTASELAANKAYLDLGKMPAESRKASAFKVAFADVSGIESVRQEAEADAPAEYFTLEGLRVANPEKGRIYIVRRGTDVSKILF